MLASAEKTQVTVEPETMKSIVQHRYGSSGVLAVEDVAMPEIGDDGILVQVRASSVNAVDWHMIRGRPYFARLTSGLVRPKNPRSGTDLAGVVMAVGADVTEFRAGDEVFGARNGAYAQYVAGRLRNFVAKPTNLTFEQAAAIPVAAVTALQALRDKGGVKAGQRVLLLGAGGGVGSFAVQLAKVFGATVSAATSPDNLEMVRSLGADEVIDYTRENVLRSGRQWDLIVDVGGYASSGDLRRAVTPGGTVVLVGAGKASSLGIVVQILGSKLRSRLGGPPMIFFFAQIKRDDMLLLAELAAAGKIAPAIDRVYPLREADDAVNYVQTGHAHGKVVIAV
jgi:NADPH:quinone reductase-like Zn-dependent oxidoreductase